MSSCLNALASPQVPDISYQPFQRPSVLTRGTPSASCPYATQGVQSIGLQASFSLPVVGKLSHLGEMYQV